MTMTVRVRGWQRRAIDSGGVGGLAAMPVPAMHPHAHAPSEEEGKDVTITHEHQTEVLNLISPDVRALLIKDVRKEWPDLTDEMGERGVNQLVAFLATSSVTEERLTPSLRVDLFWHQFLKRSVQYLTFSRALGADYIHHVPDDSEGGADPQAGRAAMKATTAAITAAGFTVDAEFWPGMGAADCSQCHAGCSDSPVNK
ncbi:hypothetical protein ACIOUE_12445 [Streptomyces xanthochromogenes]|uniref:hypothetical protein n=1 Tax=Streptomyces xanthochromogenes TaxID=67384 RepID=UPI0037FD5AA9